jgi:hypothetical protein
MNIGLDVTVVAARSADRSARPRRVWGGPTFESVGVVQLTSQRLNLLVEPADAFGEMGQPFGEQLRRRVVGGPGDLAERIGGACGPLCGVAHER